MRYATPIFFVSEGKKQYDPDSGSWLDGEIVKVQKRANVTHMGAERQKVVFGDVKLNRYVVRLQRAHTNSYDYIEIAGEKFTVDTERCPSDKRSLVVIRNG